MTDEEWQVYCAEKGAIFSTDEYAWLSDGYLA